MSRVFCRFYSFYFGSSGLGRYICLTQVLTLSRPLAGRLRGRPSLRLGTSRRWFHRATSPPSCGTEPSTQARMMGDMLGVCDLSFDGQYDRMSHTFMVCLCSAWYYTWEWAGSILRARNHRCRQTSQTLSKFKWFWSRQRSYFHSSMSIVMTMDMSLSLRSLGLAP